MNHRHVCSICSAPLEEPTDFQLSDLTAGHESFIVPDISVQRWRSTAEIYLHRSTLLSPPSARELVVTCCGHIFHEICIFHWLQFGNMRCPNCNEVWSPGSLLRIYPSTEDSPIRPSDDKAIQTELTDELVPSGYIIVEKRKYESDLETSMDKLSKLQQTVFSSGNRCSELGTQLQVASNQRAIAESQVTQLQENYYQVIQEKQEMASAFARDIKGKMEVISTLQEELARAKEAIRLFKHELDIAVKLKLNSDEELEKSKRAQDEIKYQKENLLPKIDELQQRISHLQQQLSNANVNHEIVIRDLQDSNSYFKKKYEESTKNLQQVIKSEFGKYEDDFITSMKELKGALIESMEAEAEDYRNVIPGQCKSGTRDYIQVTPVKLEAELRGCKRKVEDMENET